jgi:mannose-6-phosphate isomerase-like protein (cupin superfamily)
LEVRDVKRKYALEEAKKTGHPPEIEVLAYNIKEDFEQASVGIVESPGLHGRIRQPISNRVYLVLEGDDEVVSVGKDDVMIVPNETAHDYRDQMRLFLIHTPAYEQDSDVHLDDLWD